MGSNIVDIKELFYKLKDNLRDLNQQLEEPKDLMNEDGFNDIFALVEEKEVLLKKIRENIENERVFPKELEDLKNKVFQEALIVTGKEVEFYKVNRAEIKRRMLQMRKKTSVNKEYMNKITNSYFINRKIT